MSYRERERVVAAARAAAAYDTKPTPVPTKRPPSSAAISGEPERFGRSGGNCSHIRKSTVRLAVLATERQRKRPPRNLKAKR